MPTGTLLRGPGRFALAALLAGLILVAGAATAWAQQSGLGELIGGLSEVLDPESEGSGELSGRLIQVFGLLTLLSIAPGLLIVMTSFTRFVVVLSIMRMALGLNQSPPNMVITSLALFLTFYVMQPVFQDSWDNGLAPLIDGAITEEQAVERIAEPFHAFMASNTRDKDLALFKGFAAQADAAIPDETVEGVTEDGVETLPEDRTQIAWSVLVPAFMISELQRAFTIGFLIFVPFLAIDLIVSAILMGAGMMMLSPVMISLPFKVIFFVAIDGWYRLAGSLIQSYAGG
ncbi:flagellar type III secretion system pore protein FliP [Psychromarinibacter sp. S121]|uniref:flagellar type III secretion system pore protein FliP n=1 Tax=Psychromarinibacter sp. S121 TaxID=3415127 RepID=UPI003C7EB587